MNKEEMKSAKTQKPIKSTPKIPEEKMSKKNPLKIAKTNPLSDLELSNKLKSKTKTKTRFKIYPRKSKKNKKLA